MEHNIIKMSGKAAVNRRILAIQAKKKRKVPKKKGGGAPKGGVVTRERAAKQEQNMSESFDDVSFIFNKTVIKLNESYFEI